MIASSPAWLVLEDGTAYPGRSFGAARPSAGEVVFHTGLTGYQEILTDPSYRGQIVAMTAPQIGNYGICPADAESAGVQVAGFVVRELSARPSNWRSTISLPDYLAEAGVCGISGIDTRDLTIRIREHGAMQGVIVHGEADLIAAVELARDVPSMEGQDLVPEVTCKEAYEWQGTPGVEADPDFERVPDPVADTVSVVVYDFGVKWNILRSLHGRNCKVTEIGRALV